METYYGSTNIGGESQGDSRNGHMKEVAAYMGRGAVQVAVPTYSRADIPRLLEAGDHRYV